MSLALYTSDTPLLKLTCSVIGGQKWDYFFFFLVGNSVLMTTQKCVLCLATLLKLRKLKNTEVNFDPKSTAY